MADIEIERTHNLEFSKAREQAKKWLESAKSEYGLDTEYSEGDTQDTLKVSRTGVDGKAILDADKVYFEAKLGFLAKPLKGRIKDALEKGIEKYFV